MVRPDKRRRHCERSGTLVARLSTSCILCFLETDQGLVGEGLVHAINGLRVNVLHEMVRSLEPLVLELDPTLGGSVNARAWKELNCLGYEGVTIQAMALEAAQDPRYVLESNLQA